MAYSIEFFVGLVITGLIASYLLEGWLHSQPLVFWRRGWASNLVHVSIYLIGLSALLLLTQRVSVAVFVLFLGQLIIVTVNNVKEKTLREPFLYCDFEYFTDAIKHPRLYLPFFGYTKAAALILSLVGLFAWLIHVRIPITDIYEPASLVLAGEFLVLLVGVLILGLAGSELPAVNLKPSLDLKRLGLFSFIYRYSLLEKDLIVHGNHPFNNHPISTPSCNQPDLVTIQSESFFDPRPTFDCLKPDLLPLWDRLVSEACLSGKLDSGPWGANTIRAEFQFLTGLSADQIGVHQFHPYRKLAKRPISTLASWLKELGYKTIAIHPYEGFFYSRDKILPLLGFDELIDISAFRKAPLAGGYVSDVALGEFVANLLSEPCDQPRYLHVITMENHGPYDITTGLDDTDDPLVRPIPRAALELDIYARHLQNTDKLFGLVAHALTEQKNPGALCIFGDHVPILSHAYDTLGYPDGQTNYLIWNAANLRSNATRAELPLECLAEEFLSAVDLPTPKHHVMA